MRGLERRLARAEQAAATLPPPGERLRPDWSRLDTNHLNALCDFLDERDKGLDETELAAWLAERPDLCAALKR